MAPESNTLGGYLLGLIPAAVALVFGAFLLPRPAPADDVPIPIADAQVLARVRDADEALAKTGLSGDVRALGSALRAFNLLQVQQLTDPYVTPTTLTESRAAIDQALQPLLSLPERDTLLLALRATQLEAFVAEVKAYERTGTESAELAALGGSFVRRMKEVGWGGAADHTLAMDEDALRTMFKTAWDALLHVDHPPFAPTLDEERALYAFYLRHPHAPETTRKRIDEARSVAPTVKACAALVEGEEMAAEGWRLDKVRALGKIDPSYPTAYALGIASFRQKSYGAAAKQFADWLTAHPDGPWTLRARNYERAALKALPVD